ncbi:putative DMT superfamily transporter inner membrane protein [Serratia marcescens]|uniref:DMT family transporter n=1 Tax=Serratia marcescens TaxID=615 RepID=UPI0006693DC2|nr:DMT family transporter [Serratia marcescens]CAI0740031.1 putative DMT superfamily transporter inner membrane protein [Serratia marcescens]CAI0954019.1 putative DMT superfamily transporter inner membrane protein [Serratia marcescens]CAI1609843.1 putative DMT superfamily transporter inner membrane protein [Serratia marcescens]CAI1773645.1 putative DMT superfamily transporter inner membrane protein [Serratia marcescens]
MRFPSLWANAGLATLFVLLWSSGAIFSRWGLEHASAFAFLFFRCAIALAVLLAIGLWRRQCLPAPGTRRRVALIGVLMIGSYQICYLLALEQGITPGVLATLLGVQPILTQFITERRCTGLRAFGLALAMAGLTLVVYQSLMVAHFSPSGMLFAFIALGSMTAGTLLQKGMTQPPLAVLPLQYAIGLLMCTLALPFEPLRVDWRPEFVLPLLWMAVVISVLATFLLYRLIQRGNLVQVTSLFYLIPAVTALLDYLLLGHALAALSLLGMAGIVLGVMLVFRRA